MVTSLLIMLRPAHLAESYDGNELIDNAPPSSSRLVASESYRVAENVTAIHRSLELSGMTMYGKRHGYPPQFRIIGCDDGRKTSRLFTAV